MFCHVLFLFPCKQTAFPCPLPLLPMHFFPSSSWNLPHSQCVFSAVASRLGVSRCTEGQGVTLG